MEEKLFSGDFKPCIAENAIGLGRVEIDPKRVPKIGFQEALAKSVDLRRHAG